MADSKPSKAKFYKACKKGDVEKVEKYIAQGADVNGKGTRFGERRTPLTATLYAASEENFKLAENWDDASFVRADNYKTILDLLLSHPKIDVNKPGGVEEYPPLTIPVEQNDPALVKLLLSHPKLEMNRSPVALEWAKTDGNTKIADILKQYISMGPRAWRAAQSSNNDNTNDA
mmetsp:Transcript_20165/g.29986  ORF Transcript_20165/g.29986 Transcript_20165/m.29986 type:complete len:174 (-) Transcript_20165:54-575(-)